MKRHTLLAISTALLAGCEMATAPRETSESPAFSTSSTQTTYSGRATVLEAQLLNLPFIRLGDAGPLPESGGADKTTLLTLSIPSGQTGGVLGLDAGIVHASTVGQGNHSRAEASVADVRFTVSGNSIAAGFLMSRAEAICQAGNAAVSGSSEIARLVINGQEIVVSGARDQTIELPNGKIVINEQSESANGQRGDITVTALHVTTNDLAGNPLADVVIARSHADITCGRCNDTGHDFLTGGGWITGPSGKRANFAVAGGFKNGHWWGHLNYIDHGPTGPRVKGIDVTNYEFVDATTRRIEGTAEIDGVENTYTVVVSDRGEPGRDDTFTLTLRPSGYTAWGNLVGGNIQLHLKPSSCPVTP